MKYLSDYCQQGMTDLLQKHKAFFAFGDKQFEEAKEEGVEYVQITGGLICPKETAKEMREQMLLNFDLAVKQDIEENGIEKIVSRELGNHETTYTGDLEHLWEVLDPYKELCPELNPEMLRQAYLTALKWDKENN